VEHHTASQERAAISAMWKIYHPYRCTMAGVPAVVTGPHMLLNDGKILKKAFFR
jgi:hypothetical protein